MAVREALDLEEDDRNVQDLYHWRLAQRHCGGLWIRFRKVRLLQRLKDDVAQETVHHVLSKRMDGPRPQMLTGDMEGWQSGLMRLSREQEARKRPGVRIPRLPYMERCSSGRWCALGERMG